MNANESAHSRNKRYSNMISVLRNCLKHLSSDKCSGSEKTDLAEKIKKGIERVTKKYGGDLNAKKQMERDVFVEQMAGIKSKLENFVNA